MTDRVSDCGGQRSRQPQCEQHTAGSLDDSGEGVATAWTETAHRQTFTGSLQAKTAELPEQPLQTMNREGEPERHTQQQQSHRHRPLRFVVK